MDAYKILLLNHLNLNKDVIYYIKQFINIVAFNAPCYYELKLNYHNGQYIKNDVIFKSNYRPINGNASLYCTYICIKNKSIFRIEYVYYLKNLKAYHIIFTYVDHIKIYSMENRQLKLYLPGKHKSCDKINYKDTIFKDGTY